MGRCLKRKIEFRKDKGLLGKTKDGDEVTSVELVV